MTPWSLHLCQNCFCGNNVSPRARTLALAAFSSANPLIHSMKKYSFTLAALTLLVTPFAASAYSSMPASYYPTSNPRPGSMYSLQLGAQAMSLQNQRYYLGTDCSDYGYGDCAERLARSGSQYGPGWMIMNPQQSYGGYGGGYSGYGYGQYQPQYQPSYFGGYGYGNSYGNNSYYGNSYPSYYGGGYGNNYSGYNPYSSYNPYGGYYGY